MLYKPLKRNIVVMYIMTVTTSFAFFYPVLALYLQEQVITVQNVTFIYAIMTLGMAALEVPTGVFADFIGRRWTLITAAVIDVVAVLLLSTGTSFLHFIFYACAVALTAALSSGTRNAMLYDTLLCLNRKNEYQKIIGRTTALSAFGAGTASAIGGLIATHSLRATAVWTLIPFAIGAVATIFLLEPPREQESAISPLRHINISIHSIFSNRLLFPISAALLLFDFGAEPIYQTAQIFYAKNNIPIVIFGLIYTVGLFLGSAGAWIAHKLTAIIGNVKVVIIGLIVISMCILASTVTYGWIAIGFFLPVYAFFGLLHPILSDMTNEHVASSHRATTLSIINLGSSLGLSLFVPLIGILTDNIGIRHAYQIFTVIILLSALLLIPRKST
jgi:MFS family permease